MATRLAEADRRLDARLRRRRHGRGDDGFVLLETVFAIALISVVMAAFTTFFVNTVVNTSQQRATQAATQIADSAMETIRGLPVSDLVTGRDVTSVTTQLSSPLASSPTLQPWLCTSVIPVCPKQLMVPAIDPLAATNAGSTAVIPTSPVNQLLGSITYSVNYFLGTCFIASGSVVGTIANDPTCLGLAPTGNLTVPPIAYQRAVVAVTWPGSHCPSVGCSYITSTLVLAAASSDPTFNLTPTPPVLPVVTNPGSQTSTVGSSVSLQLAVNANTGVPPMTWAVSAGTLPAGLGMNQAGLISGTPTTVTARTSIAVTVTDRFSRTASATFTWAITASAPTAPLAVLVTNGDTQATVTWSAPASSNGAVITGYTATLTSASSGATTCTTTGARTCTFTGLTNGIVSGLTVTATNSAGTGPASAAVNVIPYPALLSGANSRLWLDGYDPTTVFQDSTATTATTAAGQPIAYWKDKSGAGNDVSIPGTVAATAPTADTADFPGMSATFTTGQYLASTTGFPTNSDYSLFTVYEPTNLTCTGNLVSGGASNSNHAFYLNGSSGLNLYHSGSFTPTNGQGVTANSAYIGSGTFVSSSGLGSVDVNGAPAVTGTISNQTSDPGIQIGAFAGGNGFCGQIAEVIVLNKAVSTSERRSVEVYLARKWGVAVTPDAPTSPAAVAGNGSALVSWTAPVYTGGAAITGYTATASNGQSCSPAPATATSCTISGLTNSTASTVTVTASNASGAGVPSAGVSVTPRPVLPGAPTAVTAVAGNAAAIVSWTAPVNTGGAAITGYTATASNGQSCSPVPATATSCTIAGLTAGIAYSITVTATNTVGTGPGSGAVSVTPIGPPTVTNPGSQAIEPNQAVSLQITATCPSGTCTYAAAAQASGGSTWNPQTISSTGLITSLVNTTGSYTIRVTVTDGGGLSTVITFPLAVQTFALTIPDQTTNRPFSLFGTTTVTLDVSALVVPNAAGYIYTLSGQPYWLTISATGILTAAITALSFSDYAITVTVTSKASATSNVSDSFSWSLT